MATKRPVSPETGLWKILYGFGKGSSRAAASCLGSPEEHGAVATEHLPVHARSVTAQFAARQRKGAQGLPDAAVEREVAGVDAVEMPETAVPPSYGKTPRFALFHGDPGAAGVPLPWAMTSRPLRGFVCGCFRFESLRSALEEAVATDQVKGLLKGDFQRGRAMAVGVDMPWSLRK